MSELNEEYTKILSELEKKISKIEERLEIIENNEKSITSILGQLQSEISEIEGDIYENDEQEGEYEFEIVCPYCNLEFLADITLINQEKNEITCPECNNIIELDWNEEDECSGHCHGCHGCGEEHDEEDYNQDEDDDM